MSSTTPLVPSDVEARDSSATLEAGGAAIPRHVAIIMDGNGRWASRRSLPRVAGHRAGAEAVRRTMQAAVDSGVEVLTLYAFSSENCGHDGHGKSLSYFMLTARVPIDADLLTGAFPVEVDTGSAKESVLKQKPRDAGLMQWGRIRL